MGRLENSLLSNDDESFDTSTGHWAASNNCTIARDTGTFFSPPGSLKLTTTTTGFTNAILAGGVVLIQPNVTFTVGYMAFSATAGLSCQINVDWYDASGAFVSSASTTSQAIGTSTWTRVWNLVTSPPAAAEARFTVGNFTATGAGQTLFVDDVQFAADSPATMAPGFPAMPSWAIMPPVPTPVAQAQIERGNDFGGGTAGTTITTGNSGGTNGDPFGFVSIPTAGQAVFMSEGTARFATRGTAGNCYGEIGSSGNGLAGMQDSPVYLRVRVRFPTLPTDSTGVPFAVVTDSVTAFQGDWRVINTGQVVLRSGAGVVLATSTSTVTAGAWFDIGCAITNASSTAGTLQAVIYDSLTGLPVETLDGGGVDTVRASGRQKILIGVLRSLTHTAVEYDLWRMSTTGYPQVAPATILTTVNEQGSVGPVTANTATVTTSSFTPGSNTLMVAYCSMGNGAGTASSLGAVSDNLAGSWVRVASDVSATGGTAEIWARDVSTGAAMSITWDPGGAGASGLALIVKNYSGAKAAASQPGTTGSNAGGTAYTANITTTVPGSVVAGALGRATDSQTLVAAAGTTALASFSGSSGDTAGLFRATAMTVTPGAGTYGYSNTPAGVNRVALAEIAPVTAPASSVSATAAPAVVNAVTAVAAAAVASDTVVAAVVVSGTTTVSAPTVQAGAGVAPAVVSAATTVGAPSVATGAGAAPSTVAGAATVGAPTTQAGAVAAPGTVAGTTAAGGTATTSSATTAAPAVVAGVVTVGSSAVNTGGTVTAAVVAGAATVGAPTVRLSAVVAPAVVQAVTAVGAPTVQAAATAAPAVVNGTAAVGSPQIRLSTTAAPAVVQAATTVGAPALTSSALPSPAVVAGATVVGAPTVRLGVSPAPGVVATTTTVGAPTLTTGSTVTPATVAGVAAVGAPAVQTGSGITVAATTVAATAAVAAPAVAAGSTTAPATVAGTAAVGAPTVRLSAAIAPPVVAATAGVPTPTVAAGSGAAPAPATVSGAATIAAPAAAAGATAAPGTVAGTTNVGAPTLSTGARPAPGTVQTAASIGVPVVGGAASAAPATVAGVGTIPAPTVVLVTTVSVGTVAAMAAVAAVAVLTSTRAAPGTVQASTTVAAPAASGTVSTAPAAITGTTTVGGPTLRLSVVALPDTVAGTVTIPAVRQSVGQIITGTATAVVTGDALPAVVTNAAVTAAVTGDPWTVAAVGDTAPAARVTAQATPGKVT